jgi:hypothetical protein
VEQNVFVVPFVPYDSIGRLPQLLSDTGKTHWTLLSVGKQTSTEIDFGFHAYLQETDMYFDFFSNASVIEILLELLGYYPLMPEMPTLMSCHHRHSHREKVFVVVVYVLLVAWNQPKNQSLWPQMDQTDHST